MTTVLDSVGDVGRYPSVTVGSDGLGLVSYLDATNNNLKAAHCTNLACTAFTDRDDRLERHRRRRRTPRSPSGTTASAS